MRCKWEWLSFSIHSIESPLTDCLNDRTYALYYAHVAPHQRYRTRQPFQSRSGHDAGRIGKGRHEARPASAGQRVVSSDALLQGQSHVSIAHNGETYQLRATRLGKLILTK